MATNKVKFTGWRIEENSQLVEDHGIGRVSRRRGIASDDRLILVRESDGLKVQSGVVLTVEDPNTEFPIVGLVKEAKYGNDQWISLTILCFFRKSELDNPTDDINEQEIFLTAIPLDIQVADIIEKAQVLTQEEFESIVIDDSNRDNTFLSRRGYDANSNSFSEEIDIRDICEGMAKDHNSELTIIRDLFVKPAKKSTSKSSPQPQSQPSQRQQTQRVSKPRHTNGESSTSKKIVSKIKRAGSTKSTSRSSRVTNHLVEHVISDDEDLVSGPLDVVEIESDSEGAKLYDAEQISDEELDDNAEEESDASDDSDEDVSNIDLQDYDDKVSKQAKKTSVYKRQFVPGPKSLATQLHNDVDDDIEVLEIDHQEDLDDMTLESAVRNLPGRADQFLQIYNAVEGALEQGASTTVYISGTPGTGKTLTTREVVRNLHYQAKEGNTPTFKYAEINGLKIISGKSAYELLWETISPNQKIASSNLPSVLEAYFQESKPKSPIIVLLDELDELSLKSNTVLYNFFNWTTYSNAKLIVIGLANTMDLPERTLANKTSSRLGLTRITFPGYTHEELIDIVKLKLNLYRKRGITVQNDSIEYAARKIASLSGDARRVLTIIERSIELAQFGKFDSKDKVTVKIVHINRAINETTNSPTSKAIRDLSYVGKLLLAGILSRQRKSGFAENTIGSVIDEIENIVAVNSTNENAYTIEGITLLEALYADHIIRAEGFNFVLEQLIESNLILVQDADSRRNSLIKLNGIEEDILSVFKQDDSLRGFAELASST
ncbi:hypothetical protein WICMUC_002806 [Wickerhamomyces mucosus]|uniref:Origin recognition complex subunit 1 n=1 Tax=Wickerhamomyces mucosus TaxID=1378264 RepID=A0A9P8PPE8_9ASCO|nr:hypothetical protein WICMUC_002806 [Wickerhamomyces mucosus]